MSSINYEFSSRIQIDVNAPVAFVFKKAFDEEVMKKWFSSPQLDFVGLENVRGFKNEIGSQWKLIFSSKKGARMEMLETITDYVENKKFSFKLTDPFFNFHVNMLFVESDGITTVSEELKGKSKNHFFNAMMRVFGSRSKKVKRNQYNKLKEIIEDEYISVDPSAV